METVFKVGMKVYDQVVFPNMEGKVVDINEYSSLPVIVRCKYGKSGDLSYTADGRFYKDIEPTLSTKPYTLENFEQEKSSAPSYEEALERARDKGGYYYLPKDLAVPSKELADATIALLKLLFLRDYYNDGWQPDWSKKNKMHFCIRVRNNKITTNSDSDINEFNTVLVFRDYTIRDKFLKEQKELLEIAKPLL